MLLLLEWVVKSDVIFQLPWLILLLSVRQDAYLDLGYKSLHVSTYVARVNSIVVVY